MSDIESSLTENKLDDWWRNQTETEIARTVPKAIEYGSKDLVDLGRECAEILGREGVSEAEAIEIGVWFYARGKFARWTAAMRRGVLVSDDTIFDIGVYAKMIQRVREVGSWPGDPSVLADRPNDLLDKPHEQNPVIDVSSFEQEPGTETIPASPLSDPEPMASIMRSVGKAFAATPAGPAINIEVSGPPGEEEIAGAEARVQAMRAIHEFRSRLKRNGYREYNAAGELYHDKMDIKVSTQYESMGDWRVKIWHGRTLTVNQFIRRDRAEQALQDVEAREWRAST